MSIKLLSAAWDLDIGSTEKMVLMCLCDYANDEGGNCWPSVATIARKCSKSERTVQAALRSLESDEYLATVSRAGTSNKFQLNPRKICTPQNLHPRKKRQIPPQNLHPIHQEPPITKQRRTRFLRIGSLSLLGRRAKAARWLMAGPRTNLPSNWSGSLRTTPSSETISAIGRRLGPPGFSTPRGSTMAATFGEAAQLALTSAAASQEQSTANSDRYQHFLKCLRLWEAMMPKKAGDEISGELMARGYWRVLGEKLSEKQMSDLTEMVLGRCKWFPTVAECREIMAEQSYGNPFYVARINADLTANGYLPPAEKQKRLADGR